MKKILVIGMLFIGFLIQTGCNDDDPKPIPLEASIGSDSKTEGEDLIHKVIIAKSTNIETYSFRINDNTTDKNTDYNTPSFSNGVTLLDNNITIPAGVSNFDIIVSSNEDLIGETDETYELSVEDKTATGTIKDNYVEIQDFIWKGLNTFYLWQESVPDLSDSKFTTLNEYVSFINRTPEPADFFESLIYNRETVDKWSWIVDDYIELENSFAGVSKSNGVDFGLVRFSGSNDIFGYVRMILPNSDASDKNIKRGDIFTKVNGQTLTISNYRDLLFNSDVDTYTLDLSEIINNTVSPTGISVTLTKYEYTENPVFITKTFIKNGHKIGYLMYNSFTANFDDDLNDAFLYFKNEDIKDLILDFRYNPGGSVSTAISLASMVTGQFKGKIVTKEQWNSKLQNEIENSNPEWLINKFSDKMSNNKLINSLHLNKVKIIITRGSASASELIINGLNPYIDVSLLGEKSSGKYTASITLYDSNDFRRENANPRHKYAMQPIVLEMVNKLGENDKDGFDPDILLPEDLANLGQLGEDNEPLLRAAMNDILGITPKFVPAKGMEYENITNSKLHTVLKDNMFVEKDGIEEIFKRINVEFK